MSSNILIATYGVLTNKKEMKRHFPTACAVLRGVIENFALEFQGHPTIKPKPNHEVPVVVWSVPSRCADKLDQVEYFNIGVFRRIQLPVKVQGITDVGFQENISCDEVTATVYVQDEHFCTLVRQPSLADYNLIFSGYQEHGLDTAVLVRAAIEVNTQFNESDLIGWEKQQEYLKSRGFTEEESELVYHNLYAKLLLDYKPTNFKA